MIKLKIASKIHLVALLICLVGVAVSQFLYTSSSVPTVNIPEFRHELIQKQHEAIQVLARLKNAVIRGGVDSLATFQFNNPDLSYYLIKQGQYLYWTANYTDIENIDFTKSWQWQYFNSNNAHCVGCTTQTEFGTLLAVIRIKNNYPFENEQLKNRFAPNFNINDAYGIEVGNTKDKFAIKDNTDNYLFSLTEPQNLALNEKIGYVGFTFSALAFILFLLMYIGLMARKGRHKLSVKLYVCYSLITFVVLTLLLFFKIPSLLFLDSLTSAFDYSAGFLLSSVLHLSLLSAFIVAAAYGFYNYIDLKNIQTKTANLLLLLILASFYILFFHILKGLVIHSGITIPLLNFKAISFASVWLHLVLFSWSITFALLFFKTHNHTIKLFGLTKTAIADSSILILIIAIFGLLLPNDLIRLSLYFSLFYGVYYALFNLLKNKSIYINATIWVFVSTLFFVANSIALTQQKTENKYRILAENIMINGNVENDRVSEIMLNELDNQLTSDAVLIDGLSNPDSTAALTSYLNENYFRGYWNKFDIQMNIVSPNSLIYNQYMSAIEQSSVKVLNTHFYSFTSTLNEIAYQGLFLLQTKTNKEQYLFINMYPRKNFKSYSFPKFLVTSETDIQARLDIAIARYRADELIYNGGNYRFNDKRSYFPYKDKKFYKFKSTDKQFYIFQPNKQNTIVIVELTNHQWFSYAVYFIYTFLICLLLVVALIWLHTPKQQNTRPQLSFSTRYQVAFVALLMVSFIGVFYVSASYISNGYKKNQQNAIDNKKAYIRNALQGMYYWTQDLAKVNTQDLNLNLQELSYMYQTDINVYDISGRLVGSSQPLIYNKNLMGKQIAPEPFFGESSSINQEESIGDLRFSTGYTDFLNGDFMQIGFISIPLYVSTEEVRHEIENFLGVVVHIYLIIALLSVLLSFIIGRQLSAPLKLIENKLKQMRFGQRNEKIEYKQNDEIGQLVQQYNKTIEELERSARLLAQTERESAWRTMARQIAHEINNPLTPMKLTIQQLQRTKTMNDERFDDYFEKSTRTLVEQIDTLSRIAGSFSNFARMPEACFEMTDIAAKLYSTTQLFISSHDSIEFNFSGEKSNIMVLADPEQIVQVFTNLFKNAAQAIPANRKGQIDVSIATESRQVIISIADNGKGIAAELQDKIFVPNFTTKTTGMGLGLSITKNIVEMAGGNIRFHSVENNGSVFTLQFKLEN